MVSEEVEKKLYNAASKGDVTTLVHLLEEDPYLVHGVLFPCSRNLLHIAAAGGHVEIASKLLSIAPEMCWRRDDQGMNPIHVSAMNGHVEILELLLLESSMTAMERLHRGQTVLHLCVKHAQIRVLKVLVEKLGELVCAKDDDGETLLHLAVRCSQLETIQYLRGNKVVELHTRNGMGKTAFQILQESHPTTVNYLEMKKLLKDPSLLAIAFPEDIAEMRNAIMVVLVLIATMAFQTVISPPGGVWNEDDDKSSRKAGQAVMASTHPDKYMNMMEANTTAFVCCLTAMFFLTIKIRHAVYPYFFILMSMLTMVVSLVAIMITFFESMNTITPDEVMQSKGNNPMSVLVMVLYILGVTPICDVLVRDLGRSWLGKKRQQVDLGAGAFPLRLRLLYWTSQLLDMHTILRAVR